MKKPKSLVLNSSTGLYEIENEPNLAVLGVYEKNGFLWVNGDFEDVENPETLRAALLDEPFEVDIKSEVFGPISDDEPARALVVHAGRLMPYVGRPVDKDNVWSAIEEMISEYFEKRRMYKAVLSTTVIPLDGVYQVETLPPGQIPSLQGVPHYIGHPDTKAIVEELGAVPAPTKLFPGLQVGEQAICFPIAQGKSTRVVDGFTSPHQEVTLADLQVRVVTRLPEAYDPNLRPCNCGSGESWTTCRAGSPYCG